MPKIFMKYPRATFPDNSLDLLAEEITTHALVFEKLPDTPYVRSNIWIYADEYAPEKVYHGGKAGGTKVISLEVNVVEGALDADAKKDFIAFLTDAVGRHAGIPSQQRVPVFVLIRDVPSYNWGMFGKPITLDGLRNPPADAKPV
jgi:phenylpyruvate tautomerase PptA (4-oxalocrotonate tautomerase family)